jgi:sporulation protein YlmC with PRC-barrel domain
MRGQKLVTIKVMAAALTLTTLLPCTIGVAFSEDAQPAANNQPTGPAANTPQAQPPAAVTILNDHEVESILGREVVSSASEDMGRIVDVLVDRRGQVRAAIIDFGGFLGVGSRKIAVDWSALQFPPPGKTDAKITLEFTRDQVKAAPEYQEGKPIVVLSALGKLEPLPE